MTERVETKEALLTEMDAAWDHLQSSLDRIDPEQVEILRDDSGWTVADHLVHLAAWERSILFLLQGRPRHEGLGVAEETYLQGDYSVINDAVLRGEGVRSFADARAYLSSNHTQLSALLEQFDDETLARPSSYFVPSEPHDESRSVLDYTYGNTAHHFREHQLWIEELMAA